MGAISGTALALGAGALVGSIAGAAGKRSRTSQTSRIDMDPASQLENRLASGQQSNFQGLQGLVNQGPGGQDVQNSLGASRDLASLLQEMQQSGGLPGQQDIQQANQLSEGMFNARRTAMDQSFEDQTWQAQQLSARLGRSVDDPVLQAKLRQGFMRQQDSLQAEQQDMSSQIAMNLPGQRVGFASQRAGVLGNLASQAFQNRSAILAQGSQMLGSERDFRLGSASRSMTGTTTEGGALGGALTGALGGMGTAQSMMGAFGAGGGMGGATLSSLGQPGVAQGNNPMMQGGPSLLGIGNITPSANSFYSGFGR